MKSSRLGLFDLEQKVLVFDLKNIKVLVLLLVWFTSLLLT